MHSHCIDRSCAFVIFRSCFPYSSRRTIIPNHMKPPFSYYGGKQKLAKRIVPLIPKHTVYVEPFCGSGAIMFAKPWPTVTNHDHYREVLNDKDLQIFNFYSVLQNKEKQAELLQRLQFTPYHDKCYQEARRICAATDGVTDIDRAWAFFVNISMSFANKLNGGWGRTVYKYNQAATWRTHTVPKLQEVLDRIDGVVFTCQDALTCIKQWDSPQTFFYCDPPYVETDQGHYRGYTQKDLEALIEVLSNCQGSFILSGYENAAFPAEWERFEFKVHAHASGKGKVNCDKTKTLHEKDLGDTKRTEVLLRVIRNENVRDEIKKLFDAGGFDCFEG